MTLVVEDMGLNRPLKSDKVNLPNKREYLHVLKAMFQVRELRNGVHAVSFADGCDGALFSSLLCANTKENAPRKCGKADGGEQAVRRLRRNDNRVPIDCRKAEVLLHRLHGCFLIEQRSDGVEPLPSGGRVLALGRNAARWIRAGKIGRSLAGSTSGQLRASCGPNSGWAGNRPPLPQSLLHQPIALGAGDRAGEYQARRARLPRRHEEALGDAPGGVR